MCLPYKFVTACTHAFSSSGHFLSGEGEISGEVFILDNVNTIVDALNN